MTVATVPCAHCRAPVPLEFEPEPNTGYVCDPCELAYYEDMARTLGGVAFRCVRCQAAVLGWELGSRLCDDCEDALHAEALEERP